MAKSTSVWSATPSSLLRLFVAFICATTLVSAYNQWDYNQEVASRGWDDYDDYGARDDYDSYAVRAWEDIALDDYTLRSLEQAFSIEDFTTRELADELRARFALNLDHDLDTRAPQKGPLKTAVAKAVTSKKFQVYIAYYSRPWEKTTPDPRRSIRFHSGVLVSPDLKPTEEVTQANALLLHAVNPKDSATGIRVTGKFEPEKKQCSARTKMLVGVMRIGETSASFDKLKKIADTIVFPESVRLTKKASSGSLKTVSKKASSGNLKTLPKKSSSSNLKAAPIQKKASSGSLKTAASGSDAPTPFTCHAFTKLYLTALASANVGISLGGKTAEQLWRTGYDKLVDDAPANNPNFYKEALPMYDTSGTKIQTSRIGWMDPSKPPPEPVPDAKCCAMM